jgi:hypothetical protein
MHDPLDTSIVRHLLRVRADWDRESDARYYRVSGGGTDTRQTRTCLANRLSVYFCGLPGSGKSTLARAVARRYNAVYLRIDTVEQALRDLCSVDVQGEGYRLAYRIASDNLRLGHSVVADSCNPIERPGRSGAGRARL